MWLFPSDFAAGVLLLPLPNPHPTDPPIVFEGLPNPPNPPNPPNAVLGLPKMLVEADGVSGAESVLGADNAEVPKGSLSGFAEVKENVDASGLDVEVDADAPKGVDEPNTDVVLEGFLGDESAEADEESPNVDGVEELPKIEVDKGAGSVDGLKEKGEGFGDELPAEGKLNGEDDEDAVAVGVNPVPGEELVDDEVTVPKPLNDDGGAGICSADEAGADSFTVSCGDALLAAVFWSYSFWTVCRYPL